MNSGYIKLHRRILENPIAQKPNYAWLWTTLLLLANHKEHKFMWNKDIILIKEGQLLTGRKELSKQTGIPTTTIERILEMLENGHQIEQQKTTKFRIITILNWGKYQSKDNKTDSISDNKRTTNGQQTDTYKNDKNVKNDKNTILATPSVAINPLIELFKQVNPSYKKLYANRTQRQALENMVKQHGEEKIRKMIELLPQTNKQQFCPIVCTPLQLEDKLGQLIAFLQKKKSEVNNNKVLKI